MRRDKFCSWIIAVLIITAVTLILASGAAASTFKVLHVFNWAKTPEGNLAMDSAGNLYGTTSAGGAYGYGVVYQLAHNADGTWKANILHSFTGQDGANPMAGVILDPAGNLYGTTSGGGPNINGFAGYGGVVYRLAPNPNGSWKVSVLHSFTGADGAWPAGGLTLDAAGNLYGTTTAGGLPCIGVCGGGVVFKLKPNSDGSWTESVLHSFDYGTSDGSAPRGELTFDAAGNLYGTTSWGGYYPGYGNGGIVYKLAPNPDGTWTESPLYNFKGGTDGASPDSSLVFDAAGNLYGTTSGGGCDGFGVVFKLSRTSSGWHETLLHTFSGYGAYPLGSLIMDAAGNLYGTASSGSNNGGLVFEITP